MRLRKCRRSAPLCRQLLSSDGAGAELVSHDRYFEPVFVIKTRDWVALMQAFRDDVTEKLVLQRCKIVDQTTASLDGFQINYAAGRSRGTVLLESLQTVEPSEIGMGPTPDKIAVKLRIHISEKWRVSG